MNRIAVEAVLLDVGGVFLLPEHAGILAALARVGVNADSGRFDRAHYQALAEVERNPSAGPSLPAPAEDPPDTVMRAALGYATAYLQAIGVPNDRVDAATEALFFPDQGFRTSWLRVRDGVLDELRALATTGVRLAIVSNADGTIEEELRALGVCQAGPGDGVQVIAVIDSALVGMAKPDPRIFALGLAAVGSSPERTLYVGDTLTYDVNGARAAGIYPIHYDPFDLCHGDGHDDIASLDELVPLLG